MLQTVISSTPIPSRSNRAHRSSSASSSASLSLPPNSPGARALKSVLQPVIASSTSAGYDNDRKFFLGNDEKITTRVREPLFEPLKLAVEERGSEAAMSERGRAGLRV